MWSKNILKTNSDGFNICGKKSPDPAFGMPIDITVPHDKPDVTLLFTSNLK
jgi:hypothetical protein